MFLTNMPHPEDVRLSFANAIQLDVIPDEEDLRHYVHDRLVNNIATKRLIDRSSTLDVEDIVGSLVDSTEGVYDSPQQAPPVPPSMRFLICL
jgi:hypothetical protein